MTDILISIAALVVVALVVVGIGWMLRPGPKKSNASVTPRDIGAITGIVGGDIGDAAVNQYALRHKEDTTGEKATLRDAAMVAAMHLSMKNASNGDKSSPQS